MVKKFKVSLYLLFTFSLTFIWLIGPSQARVKIENITYKSLNSEFGVVTINYQGDLTSRPELTFNPSLFQLAISDAYIWPKIEKKIKVGEQEFDTTVMGYQFTKDLVRVRAILPFEIEKYRHQVKMSIERDKIELLFPKRDAFADKNSVGGSRSYDENYLNVLLKEKEESREKSFQNPSEGDNSHDQLRKKTVDNLTQDLMKQENDEIKTVQSSRSIKENKPKKGFSSFNHYIVKFFIFMGLVIGLFFLLVHLFRKGVLNRGKLGLLHSNQMVNVISNTYISPKRSLVLVKVHNQVFLLGNSEGGIAFLSEIDDVTGILKKSELSIAGSNFDSNLEFSQKKGNVDGKVKLKEMQDYGEQIPNEKEGRRQSFAENIEVKERVKFSDQIKNKIKNMKPLQ